MRATYIKLPECEDEDCECGGGPMELNGLRFTCTHHRTVEGHVDHFKTDNLQEVADIIIIENE